MAAGSIGAGQASARPAPRQAHLALPAACCAAPGPPACCARGAGTFPASPPRPPALTGELSRLQPQPHRAPQLHLRQHQRVVVVASLHSPSARGGAFSHGADLAAAECMRAQHPGALTIASLQQERSALTRTPTGTHLKPASVGAAGQQVGGGEVLNLEGVGVHVAAAGGGWGGGGGGSRLRTAQCVPRVDHEAMLERTPSSLCLPPELHVRSQGGEVPPPAPGRSVPSAHSGCTAT